MTDDTLNIIDTFFPKPNDNILLNQNYSIDTITKMMSIPKANKVADIISTLCVPKVIIDVGANLGGNTMAFSKKVSNVIAYESNRDSWTMLHNNLIHYKIKNVFAYNQEFSINEDIRLMGYNNSECVVWIDPVWIKNDKYILNGLTLGGRLLEQWCKLLVKENFLCVVLCLPTDYHLVLNDIIIDDTSLAGTRLVFYTTSEELKSRLKSSLLTTEGKVVRELNNEETVPSHKAELVNIPTQQPGPVIKLHTFLQPAFPQREYVKQHTNPRAIVIEERRMLLGAIEFISRMIKKEKKPYIIVYNGDVIILKEMFPDMKFVKESDEIKNEKNVLYISTEDNLENQKQKMLSIKPFKSLLRFSLPFDEEETSYFDGIIFFQAYGNVDGETYLELNSNPKTIKYNNNKYNKQLFFFNTTYRIQNFKGYEFRYGWSYDTIREYYILKAYLIGKGLNDIQKWSEKFDSVSIHKVVVLLQKM